VNLRTVTIGAGAAAFNFIPIFIAQRDGLFEKHGLEVQIKRTGSTEAATAALLSGDLDIAITPPEGALANYVAGGPLRVIGGNLNGLPLSLIANPRFQRIEDLRGAKLGTSSLTEGTAIYTMEILSRHGLRYPGDYEFSLVGVHTARWQALQSGALDAALQLIPLNFVAEDCGYKNLGEAYQYIPEIAFISLIVDIQWAEKNDAVLLATLKGIREGVSRFYDPRNDEAILRILADIVKAEPKYIRQSLDLVRSRKMVPHDLAVPAAALETSVRLLRSANLLAEPPGLDPLGVLDSRFVQAAQVGSAA
jgi:ABC-type nitrate/sulfonate/bicarbonate transport system substrate-binding protein